MCFDFLFVCFQDRNDGQTVRKSIFPRLRRRKASVTPSLSVVYESEEVKHEYQAQVYQILQDSSARCQNDFKCCNSIDNSKASSTTAENGGSVASRSCTSTLPSIIEDEKTAVISQSQCKEQKQEASAPSMTENLMTITLENEAKLNQQDNISNNHGTRDATANPNSDASVSNTLHKGVKQNNVLIDKNSTNLLSVKTVAHNKKADGALSSHKTIKRFSRNVRDASNSNRHTQDVADHVCHYLSMFRLSQPSVNDDFLCSEILLENKSNHAMCADEEENSMPDLHPWSTSTTRYRETRRDDHERNFQSSATEDSIISVEDTSPTMLFDRCRVPVQDLSSDDIEHSVSADCSPYSREYSYAPKVLAKSDNPIHLPPPSPRRDCLIPSPFKNTKSEMLPPVYPNMRQSNHATASHVNRGSHHRGSRGSHVEKRRSSHDRILKIETASGHHMNHHSSGKLHKKKSSTSKTSNSLSKKSLKSSDMHLTSSSTMNKPERSQNSIPKLPPINQTGSLVSQTSHRPSRDSLHYKKH